LLAFLLHCLLAVALTWNPGLAALFLTLIILFYCHRRSGVICSTPQHNFPIVSFSDTTRWTYDKAALESSSFLVTGPIMAWFTATIGYHHVPHLNSRISRFTSFPTALPPSRVETPQHHLAPPNVKSGVV